MNNNIKSILIIGLGLIGGSIAKAAKEKGITVYAFDIDSNIVDKAFEKKIIDYKISNFDEVTESKMDSSVDLIIISVTPTKTLEVINSIKELWNTKITITETSSVKNHLIFKNINNIVFSHPIAGSDKSGIDNSDANLFTYKKNIICKSSNTDQFHLDRLKSFWENALMMNVAEMSIKEHDQIFAITSHLPHLLAYALIDSIRISGINISDNAGAGLKEFIRLSGSNPEMWRDILEINSMNVIKSLASMQISINNLLELLTKSKEIPSILTHSDLLKEELEEIKKFKEDNF
ncbi:prephenate dehydrogenase/arogenate dehydrogenase family protein [SAR86 cluster bacterium]|nr:prephenate dehydrogenase/arogenate dehydrogenase family protein [SAR86 cluster bacterium]